MFPERSLNVPCMVRVPDQGPERVQADGKEVRVRPEPARDVREGGHSVGLPRLSGSRQAAGVGPSMFPDFSSNPP